MSDKIKMTIYEFSYTSLMMIQPCICILTYWLRMDLFMQALQHDASSHTHTQTHTHTHTVCVGGLSLKRASTHDLSQFCSVNGRQPEAARNSAYLLR